MKKEFDVIIAGNGVLGYSTAFALSREFPEMKIAVIGEASKRGSASLAAGAMLASFAEIEKGSLDSAPAQSKFKMSRQATSLWPAWAAEINQAIGREQIQVKLGTYLIHNAQADALDDENFQAVIDTLKAYKEDFSEVDPREIKGLSPSTRARPLRVLYLSGEGYLNSSELPLAFERYFEVCGNVQLIHENVKRIDVDSELKRVHLSAGSTLVSKQVIVACGASSQNLIDQIPELKNQIPRLFYGVGTSLVVKTEAHAPSKVIRTLNRGLACGIHVVPYDQDHCYIGATNFISPIPEYEPRMTSLYSLLQGAMEQIHTRFYKAQVVKVNVGHRPTTADTYPLIGQTSIPGLWILSGTKRDGIHLSPLLAKAIAAEFSGKPALFENPFRPERRLIRSLTKAEAIEKSVRHLWSAAYQHELELPKAGWEPLIEAILRQKVEEVYAKTGIEDFGIHPEMLDMFRYGHVSSEAY